jgi:two-component system response regulator HydG
MFRQDLMYRLEVITLTLPPLRERMQDLPELVEHCLASARQRHGKAVTRVREDAMAVLRAHSWPGNVRELANVIERAVVFTRNAEITPAELPGHLARRGESVPAVSLESQRIAVPLGTSLRDVEELLIRKTLEATDGDKNMTAKLLGINSRTIYRKLAPASTREDSGERKPEPETDL